jgi:uncharacterized protein YcnI
LANYASLFRGCACQRFEWPQTAPHSFLKAVLMLRYLPSNATYLVAAYALFAWPNASFAHINLEQGAALAGTYYKANLRVGHGCEGTATHTVKVQIPAAGSSTKGLKSPAALLEVLPANQAHAH